MEPSVQDPIKPARQRVLIVDDHALFRAGLRGLLAQEPSLEVVGEAENGRDAVSAVGQLSPQLVLMDLTMPGMNGVEAAAQIKQRYPDVRILIMTLHDTEEFIHASLKAGADGYILKEAKYDELRVAIRNVLAGKGYLSIDVSAKVIRGYMGGVNTTVYDTLTARERAVLKLIAEGNSNKHVARFLNISFRTVAKHRANLMSKLDVHNASGLTAYAIEKGLVA